MKPCFLSAAGQRLRPQNDSLSALYFLGPNVLVSSLFSHIKSYHHAMKTYWGVEVWIHTFLATSPNGGKWSASRLGRFIPGNHWIRRPVPKYINLQNISAFSILKRKVFVSLNILKRVKSYKNKYV